MSTIFLDDGIIITETTEVEYRGEKRGRIAYLNPRNVINQKIRAAWEAWLEDRYVVSSKQHGNADTSSRSERLETFPRGYGDAGSDDLLRGAQPARVNGCECGGGHYPDHGACPEFFPQMGGFCVYCNHAEPCHLRD